MCLGYLDGKHEVLCPVAERATAQAYQERMEKAYEADVKRLKDAIKRIRTISQKRSLVDRERNLVQFNIYLAEIETTATTALGE